MRESEETTREGLVAEGIYRRGEGVGDMSSLLILVVYLTVSEECRLLLLKC